MPLFTYVTQNVLTLAMTDFLKSALLLATTQAAGPYNWYSFFLDQNFSFMCGAVMVSLIQSSQWFQPRKGTTTYP